MVHSRQLLAPYAVIWQYLTYISNVIKKPRSLFVYVKLMTSKREIIINFRTVHSLKAKLKKFGSVAPLLYDNKQQSLHPQKLDFCTH